MVGYACDETEELMPLPISLAHRLARKLSEVRKNKTIPYLRPDGKSQVTLEYADGKPICVNTVVVSAQHHPKVEHAQIEDDIKKLVIDPVIPEELVEKKPRIYVNPTGRFDIGGPQADSGLTGRKIIVDTYGGCCASRRWSFFRQRSDKGRPLRCIYGALCGEKYRCSGDSVKNARYRSRTR
jgi:S-adenosylmethionine synthetase